MVETARAIAARPDAVLAGKTIVLTGAMVPYAFGSSDGLFNLGSAVSFVQVLPPGVYVAMNGRIFEWDAVSKDREAGIFIRRES
jgi:L-asparaginase